MIRVAFEKLTNLYSKVEHLMDIIDHTFTCINNNVFLRLVKLDY